MPVLFAPILTRFAAEILEAAGAPADQADIAAESLIASNLRGVDSHGLQLLPFYIEQILAGEMDPKADGAVVSESGSCLVFDAQNALGQWVAETCCGHAIRLAATHGAGVVVARESNHFGAAAWWAQKMRAAGQIGLVFCNASPIVPPWQGREGRIGTNPICMSVPGPWLLDMATTTVAAGKIFKAFINDKPEIPAGWAFDSQRRAHHRYQGGLQQGHADAARRIQRQRPGADGGDSLLGAERRRHGQRSGRNPHSRPP